jgi:hypothetical protein
MPDGGVRPPSTRRHGDDEAPLGFPRLTGQGLSRWGGERLTSAVRPTKLVIILWVCAILDEGGLWHTLRAFV